MNTNITPNGFNRLQTPLREVQRAQGYRGRDVLTVQPVCVPGVQGEEMRYAKRRDQNEPGIKDALEKAGFDVVQTDEIDLIAGKAGKNYLLEVKLEGVTESRIRPLQRWLRDNWRGQYAIVTTPVEALRAVGAI
jgi:hypothetical protein